MTLIDFPQYKPKIDAWLTNGSMVLVGEFLIVGIVNGLYVARDRFQVDCWIDKEGELYYDPAVVDKNRLRILPQ